MGWRGLKSSGSGQGQVAHSCGHVTNFLGSIKCEKFLDKLTKLSASQQGLCSMLLHRASCRFAKYHTTNKCTNCVSCYRNM